MSTFFMHNKKGVSLVEVVIACGIIALTLSVLVSVYSLVSRYSLSNVRVLKATQLVEEESEVLNFLQDSSWTNNIVPLQNNTTYRLYWTSALNWVATTSPILLENRYDVTFVLNPVYRDVNFNIVTNGGSVDSGSRKVNLTVSWHEGSGTTTKSAEIYLFNTFNN